MMSKWTVSEKFRKTQCITKTECWPRQHGQIPAVTCASSVNRPPGLGSFQMTWPFDSLLGKWNAFWKTWIISDSSWRSVHIEARNSRMPATDQKLTFGRSGTPAMRANVRLSHSITNSESIILAILRNSQSFGLEAGEILGMYVWEPPIPIRCCSSESWTVVLYEDRELRPLNRLRQIPPS